MTEPDDFTRSLEQLEVPQVGDMRHREFVRELVLSAPRTAALSVWYVLIPGYVLACAVMKAAFGIEPHVFAVFDGVVRALRVTPLGPAAPALLFLGLPLVAVLLNLAVLVHVSRTAGRDGWHAAARRRPINVLLVFLGLLVSGLYAVYLLLRA